MKFKNANVLITGGASGIGRIMGRMALEKGANHLIIWDINPVNIASAGGMLSNPKMSVYAASKWGVIGWSDSVRIELQEMKSKVRVTTIAPYYINTGMFDGVKSRIIPILKPEYVAKKVIRAIEKNEIFRGIPFGFHFIRFWQTVLPVKIFDFFFGKVFGIYHAMDDFTGRK
jgi:short-subunit dehydrogenase